MTDHSEPCGCEDSACLAREIVEWALLLADAAKTIRRLDAALLGAEETATRRLYLKRLECVAMKLQLRERCIYSDGIAYNGMAVCSTIQDIREIQDRRKRTWESRTKRIEAALAEARRP